MVVAPSFWRESDEVYFVYERLGITWPDKEVPRSCSCGKVTHQHQRPLTRDHVRFHFSLIIYFSLSFVERAAAAAHATTAAV